MSVSDKDFHEILYNHLPQLYRTEDAKIAPISHPLKRFMQVASTGFKELESEIDGLQLLFNADFMPEKYLDPIGRMLGFNFPLGTTVTEKRRIIKNLPTLYKLKGNEKVYDMLARLLFHMDAKTSTEWVRSDTTTNVVVNLEIGDSKSADIDAKMERFQELVQFFRPVNVGNSWAVVVFYDYEIELGESQDIFDFITMMIDDNLNVVPKGTAFLNSNRTLGDNFNIYGGHKIPEFYNIRNVTDESVDRLTFEVTDYDIQLNAEESNALDTIYVATETELSEVYPLDNSMDVIVDYSQMLNYGVLGSTMVLNNKPKYEYIGGL